MAFLEKEKKENSISLVNKRTTRDGPARKKKKLYIGFGYNMEKHRPQNKTKKIRGLDSREQVLH